MDTSVTKRNTTDSLADNSLVSKSQQPITPTDKTIARSHLTLEKLNPLLKCQICSGYLVDATKLTLCNHTFCRACIWKEFENSKNNCPCKSKTNCKCFSCPVVGCSSVINKLNPSASLIPDTILQDIVYKLVPGLYKNEMKRRKIFYEQNKDPEYERLSQEDRGEIPENRVYYTVEDKISLSLEYGFGENQMPTCELSPNDSARNSHTTSSSTENSNSSSFKNVEQEAAASRRYLLAPAGFSIKLLKKYVLCKWDLPNTKYRAQVFYLEDELDDDLNLMDIAYIYSWKRMAPLRLFYRFIPRQPKASKLNKIRASQSSSVAINNTQSLNNEPRINNNQQANQINYQSQISHQSGCNLQPVTKKPKIDPSPSIVKPATTSLNPRPCQSTMQPQNRSSPLQTQSTMRHSPAQQALARASPVRLINNNSPLVRVSPSAANLPNASTAKHQSISTSNTSSLQHMFNQMNSSQAKATSSSNPTFSPVPSTSNQKKINLTAMKRTLSKGKLNSTIHSNLLDQSNEYESATKYRKSSTMSNNNAFQSSPQRAFAKPVNAMSNQIDNSLNANTIGYQQRKQNTTLNTAKTQFNQAAQYKMNNKDVHHLNSSLNISNLNPLNNLNNLHNLNYRSSVNNVPSTITSSSTVSSLRNVRVPSTGKEKIANSMTSNRYVPSMGKEKISNRITLNRIAPNTSSQINDSNSIANKYKLPSEMIPVSSAKKSNMSSSFNIMNILNGNPSNKKEDKSTDLLGNFNANSLSSLNHLNLSAAALERLNNINTLTNHFNNSPISPTSLNNKRKSSLDKSPTNEFGSLVTEKGIKIFKSGILSPTGSSSSNHSLSGLNSSLDNSLNKSKSNEKHLPIKSSPTTNSSLNECKSPHNQLKVSNEKSPQSISSNQSKSSQPVKLESQRQEEIKKIATATPVSAINQSMNSLNAVTKSSNALITSSKISPTLEAVGLSSKAATSVDHSKKGASLDKIVNKITSSIIGKANSESNNLTNGGLNFLNRSNQTSTTKNNTSTTNSSQSNCLSFAQAVHNGLKTAAEQKSSSKTDSSSINSASISPKPVNDNVTIKLPLLTNGNNVESSSSQQQNSNRSSSPASSTGKDTNSKSLFLNSQIEVTFDEDEMPKQESEQSSKNQTNTKQVFSDVDIDVDDDDSMDDKLIMAIPPETENSSSSAADELSSSNVDSITNEKSSSAKTNTVVKQQIQNQSLCAIQANTPPSSSPDFSKKFPSSRSNSPISSICDDKLRTNAHSADHKGTDITQAKQLTADPVSPPLTPSPRLCETQTSNRENNFGALDLSTGPRKTVSPINIPTPKIAETV